MFNFMAKDIINPKMFVDPSIYGIVSSLPPSEATLDWIKEHTNN